MEQYKEEFIHFMVESHVLKFGSFTLKSGRQSPFFMNAGAYVTGEQLHRLGKYYAQAIHDNFGLDFDVVFGPAYKGIPLAVVRYQQQRCVDRLRVGVITHDEDVHAGPLSVFAMMSNHTITRKRFFMSDKLARARHTRSADLAASAASPQTQPDTHVTDPASGESCPSQGGADQGSTAAIGGSAALISICTIISRITGFART